MPVVGERLKNAWNAFLGRDPTRYRSMEYTSFFSAQNTKRFSFGDKSIVNVICNRIAVDCAAVNINHVRVDENGRYIETIDDSLNRALTIAANLDQTGRELILETVLRMLLDGYVALVPVSTDRDPNTNESFKIYEIRVGKIIQFLPKMLRVKVYNEDSGKEEELLVEKRYTVVVENPFYSIMNEANSTLQRLLRVLAQLERSNDMNSSGKLDMIIQLPYQLKTDAKREYANQRKKDIEAQLTNSVYGIAYTDSTEKVIQLNRSLENNLWTQAKELTEEVMNQMGFTKSIFDGTADEATMLNYNNQIIEPILSALVENMEKNWLSQTAMSQGQRIRFFKDPFKLVPVSQIAEIADKFTRNEIMTSNEIRSVIGMKPSNDPKADMLVNSNLNQSKQAEAETRNFDEIQNQE